MDVTVNLYIIFVEYFQEREKYAKMQEKLKNWKVSGCAGQIDWWQPSNVTVDVSVYDTLSVKEVELIWLFMKYLGSQDIIIVFMDTCFLMWCHTNIFSTSWINVLFCHIRYFFHLGIHAILIRINRYLAFHLFLLLLKGSPV